MIKIHTQKKLLYSFLLLSLVGILGSCSKENMTVNMVGVYKGNAVLNDWTTSYQDSVYKNVQIEVSKVDWQTIRLNFILDPNTPGINISRNFEITYKTSFAGAEGAPRTYSINMTGSVNGATLTFKYSYQDVSRGRKILFEGTK